MLNVVAFFFLHPACSFDFEDGIGGWTKTGTAFDNQPTFGDNPTARGRESAEQQGDWWIGGAEVRPSQYDPPGVNQGDIAQGTLTSPCFLIVGREISFLIGGGCGGSFVRAELIVNNKVNISDDSLEITLDVRFFLFLLFFSFAVVPNNAAWPFEMCHGIRT